MILVYAGVDDIPVYYNPTHNSHPFIQNLTELTRTVDNLECAFNLECR